MESSTVSKNAIRLSEIVVDHGIMANLGYQTILGTTHIAGCCILQSPQKHDPTNPWNGWTVIHSRKVTGFHPKNPGERHFEELISFGGR